MKRLIGIGVAVVVVAAIVIQLVPYGHDHSNPAVTAEPKWDSPQTRELAVRACFDCHSNQTVWPWYSDVAPFSWLIVHDVREGRSRLNLSTMDQPQRETRGAGREVQRGTMPPSYYIIIHPPASLSASEKDALAQGLQKTLGGGSFPSGGGEPQGERRKGD